MRVEGLTFVPHGSADPVLDGVGLCLRPGERVLLAGASGSGKSTLLRALAGVLEDTGGGEVTGPVEVDGERGLLLQDPADAVVARTVGRDVAFGAENAGVPRAQVWERVRECLDAVSFPYAEDHETRALSGGEAQRLALAGVLALRPGLLLLDEPCSMLDPGAAAAVRDAVADAVRASGATLVVVEHRLEHWVDLCERLVVLGPRGAVVADGPLAPTLAARAGDLTDLGLWVPGAPDPHPVDVDPALLAPASTGSLHARIDRVERSVQPGLASWQVEHPARLALQDVACAIGPGEMVALRGPSGAGKSTLLACLGGMLTPTRGEVRYRTATGPEVAGDHDRGGVDPDGLALGDDARMAPVPEGPASAGSEPTATDGWVSSGEAQPGVEPDGLASVELARWVGWVPQEPELPVVARTVLDEVLAGARALGETDDAERRARSLLDLVGLGDRLDADPRVLSGGEQRRLAIVAAVVHRPRALLLDEPSVGQDRHTWAVVAGLAEAARHAGAAVAVSTHDALLAERATREVVLARPDRTDPSPRRRGQGLAPWCSPLPLVGLGLLAAVAGLALPTVAAGLVVLGVELGLLLVMCGLRWPQPVLRLVPLTVGAASLWWSNWWWSPGRDAVAALLPALRMATAALPGVVLSAYLEPFALGDALGQRLRLPARPVLAAVAALQRFDGLRDTHAELRAVRRVRGLLPRGVAGSLRGSVGLTFALLVLALRHAGRTAVAMEARGFSSPVVRAGRRTWAEPARWGRGDVGAALLALVLAACGLGVHLIG